MQRQDVAAQNIGVRRCGAEQHRFFAQKRRARVLHPAVCHARNEYHVVLWKGKRLREIVSQKCDPFCRDLLQLRNFLLRSRQLRFAKINGWFPCLRDFLKRPGGEGNQVGRQRQRFRELPHVVRARFAFGVRDHAPIKGCIDGELEFSFDVRLIETGKCHARVHRYEQRVHVLGAVVIVFVLDDRLARRSGVRREVEVHRILARVQQRGGNNDVSILDFRFVGLTIDHRSLQQTIAVVEQRFARLP